MTQTLYAHKNKKKKKKKTAKKKKKRTIWDSRNTDFSALHLKSKPKRSTAAEFVCTDFSLCNDIGAIYIT
jgi:hypothetical protein